MGYEVNTPVFDGPFDLLLHLILKEEVDIHEVSLLGIVEAYLAEVQKMQEHFSASTSLYIKTGPRLARGPV